MKYSKYQMEAFQVNRLPTTKEKRQFAEMWDALSVDVADVTITLDTIDTDHEVIAGKPEYIAKTSDLIFPDQSSAMTVQATLKDIQISRGDGGSIGKALGIKPKTTHFKLATPMGYKSIHDLRIVHAKDDVPPFKVGVTESEESIKVRTTKQFNLYTNRASVIVSPLPVAKPKS